MRTPTSYLATLTMLLAAIGCSTTAAHRIKTEQSNPEWSARPIEKILVIGVYERTYRISAESVFVAELKERGLNAVASYEVFADLENMDEAEEIERKLAELNVDAVLSIATLEAREEYDRNDWWLSYGLLRLLGSSRERAEGWADIGDAGAYYSQGDMVLDVRIFDARNLVPIWNATTDSYMFHQGDADEVKELAGFMVDELSQRGIL